MGKYKSNCCGTKFKVVGRSVYDEEYVDTEWECKKCKKYCHLIPSEKLSMEEIINFFDKFSDGGIFFPLVEYGTTICNSKMDYKEPLEDFLNKIELIMMSLKESYRKDDQD